MENQRIRLSKLMLKQGLLTLLQTKPLSEITIYELCETAQINRTTFYKYYGSQTDLLNEITADFFQEIDAYLQKHMEQKTDGFPSILNYLYRQRDLFCILINTIPAQNFADQLFAIPGLTVIFENIMQASGLSDVKVRYLRKFIYHGIFAILCEWLTSEKPESVEEMLEIFVFLRKHDFCGIAEESGGEEL